MNVLLCLDLDLQWKAYFASLEASMAIKMLLENEPHVVSLAQLGFWDELGEHLGETSSSNATTPQGGVNQLPTVLSWTTRVDVRRLSYISAIVALSSGA